MVYQCVYLDLDRLGAAVYCVHIDSRIQDAADVD